MTDPTIGHPNSSYVTTKLYERLHVDATVIRYFQKELFSRFLPSPYVVHANMAVGKPWLCVQNLKDGSTVEFVIFCVQDFFSA